jgi:hypothetical protein
MAGGFLAEDLRVGKLGVYECIKTATAKQTV